MQFLKNGACTKSWWMIYSFIDSITEYMKDKFNLPEDVIWGLKAIKHVMLHTTRKYNILEECRELDCKIDMNWRKFCWEPHFPQSKVKVFDIGIGDVWTETE